MASKVATSEELADALKVNADTIEIEGDLVSKVVRLRATGNVAWAVAVAALTLAITIMIGSRGRALFAAVPVGGAAVAILGLRAATTAIAIGFAAGGVSALRRLRNYREVERSEARLVLKR